MKLSEFDYTLPKDLIAQHPSSVRDQSRLMILDRKNNTISNKVFSNFPDYLHKGDLLILNNTKVFPARLIGSKKGTGGKIEILLVQDTGSGIWKAMVKSSGKLIEKMEIDFGLSDASAILIKKDKVGNKGSNSEIENNRFTGGLWLVQFSSKESVKKLIERIGLVPLPPYIKRDKNKPSSAMDKESYQTIYASKSGAIAAPTAGLHFTGDVLRRIKEKEVEIAEITLHVGAGTFKPVKTDLIKEHSMDSEYFEIDAPSEKIIKKSIKEGRRIIAVGTTSVRTLEGIKIEEDQIKPRRGYTNLFIYPGFKFKHSGALLTNFHLPKSTLLMLVYAFAGKELAKKAYQEAIKRRYRFYSYGDAMLVL